MHHPSSKALCMENDTYLVVAICLCEVQYQCPKVEVQKVETVLNKLRVAKQNGHIFTNIVFMHKVSNIQVRKESDEVQKNNMP